MSFLLASAARATVGARSGQEDAFRVWPAEGPLRPKASGDGLLAVLADGMGGHAGGAVAGQTACATFADVFVADGAPYEERLKSALQASNEALAKGVEQNSALRGMGCTLVAAWIDKSGLRWTSVGDSLLLLYRFPDVIRLNADHSLGSYLDEQVRQNRITAGEARAAPNRNALRSALTGSKIDLIDLHGEPLDLHAGDWILLASDGIGSLTGDELADVIYRYRQSTPEEMADGLVGAVARKNVPEQDNTTVVAVRVEGTSQISTSRLTTRILRPGAAASPGGAPDKRRGRSIFSAALEVSPAVWLGAAAGLLVIAIFLAVRMLPSSSPSAPSAPSANLPVFPQAPSPPPQGSSGPTEPQAPDPPRSPPPYPPSGPPEASIPPVVSPPAPPAVRGAPKQEGPSSGRPSGGTPDRSGPRPVAPKEASPGSPGPGAPPSPSAPPGVESIVPPGSVPAPVPNRPPPPEGPEQTPKSNKGADSAKELGKELGNQ